MVALLRAMHEQSAARLAALDQLSDTQVSREAGMYVCMHVCVVVCVSVFVCVFVCVCAYMHERSAASCGT